MVVPHFMAFVFSILLLQTFTFPDLILAQRNGETGRYMYTDDTNQNRYCQYCDENDLNTEVIMAQVNQCIKKNFPFANKTDEQEQRSKLRPLCKRGKLPSCPLLHRTLNGEWNCGHSPLLMESEFYDKTVDGYILPVYTSCSLVCIEGYHVIGTNIIHCDDSHQWDTETGAIHCAKNPGRNGDIEEHHLPVIIGSVISVVAIGIVGIIICCYVCKGASYETAEEESSVESDASSIYYFKGAVEHEETKVNEDTVNEINSLLKPNHPVSNKKVGDLGQVRTSDRNGDKKEGRPSIGKKTLHFQSNRMSSHGEAKYLKNLKTPVEHKDLSDVYGVRVESKSSYSMQEQINKGLQEDQMEIVLRASYKGDNDDKAMNHVEGGGDLMTHSCQVLSKRREPGDGIEAGDNSHEHKDDPLLKSKNLNKGIIKTVEIMDTNINQLCDKGKRIDSVVKTDMTVDPLGLDNLKVSHPQNMSEFKDLVVKDDDTHGSKIQLLRNKHKKEPTGGRKESLEIAEGCSHPKVKVAYVSEEQGREQLMVREYNVNKFSVPYGKRFFIVPKCQGTISRLNVCKDEGRYRGLQYDGYQFLHMVESAGAEDHGSYRWEIFVEECSSPKYTGILFIYIVSDQLDSVSIPPLDSNLLSSPFWQSMNTESLLDDSSLSVRDRPSGTSCPPIINQAGSGAITGLHQLDTGSATCPGVVAAAQNLDAAVSRRQCSSDPCHCTQTVESAWNDNSLKMEELIHRGENESMPWTHLGSHVLNMKPWFLECLEWHLRGRVHDGPMKYILKQMVHDGKKIGHLVEHFACVRRYDLVNCIKAFHSCDYCKCFYNR